MKKIILAIFIFFLGSINSIGQDTISSSGNYFSKINFNYSWTIGELIVNTMKKFDIIMTQGFHQTEIDFGKKNNKKEKTNKITFNMFPSPSYGRIKLKITNARDSLNYYKISFYDSAGKLVITKNTKKRLLEIDLKNIPPGIYFITIRDNSNNEIIGSSRITKL